MNFIIYLSTELLTKIIPFISLLILAKYVDVSSFGELTLYFIIFEFLVIFVGNNISAVTRIDFFNLTKRSYRYTKTHHLIGSLFIFFIFGLCLFLFFDINQEYILCLLIASLMRTVSYYVLADLQCNEKATTYAIYNFTFIISTNLSFMYLIINGYEIHSWFYSILFGSFMQFLLAIKYIKHNKILLFHTKFFISFSKIYKEFRNGIIFIPQAIGFWISVATDRFLIAHFLGNLVVGYYMFVYRFATPIIILSSAINLYLTPKINKLLKTKELEKLRKILFKFSILIIFLSILNYLAIYFLINLYYQEYAIALNYLSYIIVSLILQAIYLIYMNVFYYIGMKKFISKLIFIIAIIKVILVYFSIKYFGIDGLLNINIMINFIVLVFTVIKFQKELKKIKESNGIY